MVRLVNREAWADVVRELLPLTKGKKATLARLLGVDPKTIDLWLQGRVTVSEASVRQVAERTDLNAMHLLIRVGYYSMDDLPPRITDEQIDEEQRIVLERDDLDDEQKAYILQELDAMRSTDQQLIDDMARRDRHRRNERIAVLIDQFKNRRVA